MKETTPSEKVTELKERAAVNLQEATDTVSTKLGAVKDTIVDGAKSAGTAIVDLKDRVVEKLVDAKDWTAEKAANPEKTLTEVKESVAAGTRTAGVKLDDVKVWTAEKAKQVDEMFDKGQAYLQLLSDKIDRLKEWTEEKAKAAAEGLGTAKGLLGQVGETLSDAQSWTDERAVKAGETLDKAKEVLVKTERILENKADVLAVEMKTRSALIHEEIVKLEATMHARGQKSGKGCTDKESEALRSAIQEKRAELGEAERELKSACTDAAPKADACHAPAARKPGTSC